MTDQLSIFRPPWAPADFNENKLTGEERAVLGVLRWRTARSDAIKASRIATVAGIDSERRVRRIIRRLRFQHGLAIVSAPTKPPGYYLTELGKEYGDCLKSLKKRALKILAVVARGEKKTMPELLGQLSLEVK